VANDLPLEDRGSGRELKWKKQGKKTAENRAGQSLEGGKGRMEKN